MKKMSKASKMMALAGACVVLGFAMMASMFVFDLMPFAEPTTTTESWALAVFLSGGASVLLGCFTFLRYVEPWIAEGLIENPENPSEKQ